MWGSEGVGVVSPSMRSYLHAADSFQCSRTSVRQPGVSMMEITARWSVTRRVPTFYLVPPAFDELVIWVGGYGELVGIP